MKNAKSERQSHLHSSIERYVNGGGRTRAAKLLALIAPVLAYRLAAREVIDTFRSFWEESPAGPTEPVSLDIRAYDGTNELIIQLMERLAPMQEWLYGAYVHGSLGTEAAIPYSDFDGLLILRNTVFESTGNLTRAAASLGSLRRIMYRIDPLQHHGWFVLTQADLDYYCNAYFPIELFQYSRSLLPGRPSRLNLKTRDSSQEYRQAFEQLSRSLLARIEANAIPDNAYELKSFLSQVMLLPALYLQARDGTAVYKKFSFDMARADFESDIWFIMDEFSGIRLDWHYETSRLTHMLLSRFVSWRPLVVRWLPPAIAPDLVTRISQDSLDAVKRLIEEMHKKMHV